MRRLQLVCSLLAVLGACSLGYGFEIAWTDSFGETTYTIAGPDVAMLGDSVRVLITVMDPFYPNDMVAAPWSFEEDSIEVDGGFGIFLTDTLWVSEYTFVYGAEGTHAYTFSGQDLGHGGGAHSWSWFAIGSTTVISPPTSAAAKSWGGVKTLFRR